MKKLMIIMCIIWIVVAGTTFYNNIYDISQRQQRCYGLVLSTKDIFRMTPVQRHDEIYELGKFANRLINVYQSRLDKRRFIDRFIDYCDWKNIEHIDLQYCHKTGYGL